MSDEEEDYMSDTFLKQFETVKPVKLVTGTAARRLKQETKHREAATKHKSTFKPMKEREQEQRQKGLSKAISSDNKGFAMLQKMGYKQGMGLGKTGSGRTEPVSVDLKAGRGGLGQEAEMKRKQVTMAQMREQMKHKRVKLDEVNRGQFVQNMSSKFKDKEVERDLYDSQKACEHLDQTKDVSEPEEPWYWPERPKETEEDEEDEEKEEEEEEEEEEKEELKEEYIEDCLTPQEKLEQLTYYLSSQHTYCVWCGTSYENKEDLSTNCPGNTAEAHR